MAKKKKKQKKKPVNKPQQSNKSKPTSQPPKESRQPVGEVNQPRFSRGAKTAWWFVGAMATLVTLVGGYLLFVPRISISSSAPLNPANPFSTPFTVSNDGHFSLYDITFQCKLHEVVSDRFAELRSMEPGGIFTTHEALVVRQMFPAETNDIPCLFPVEMGNVTRADISIVLDFRPKFIPWHIERNFRFITSKGSDGSLRWLSKTSK